jgi:hypothetical protein
MIEKIICFGCSYTAGHDSLVTGRTSWDQREEYPPEKDHRDYTDINYAYPARISAELDIPVMNAATLGNSNQSMFVDIYKWLHPDWATYSQHEEQNKRISKDITDFEPNNRTLAIVGLTSPFREIASIPPRFSGIAKVKTTEYLFNENNQYVVMNLASPSGEEHALKYPDSEFGRQYLNYIEQQEWLRYLKCQQWILAMDALLTRAGIPHIFINFLALHGIHPITDEVIKKYNFYIKTVQELCLFDGEPMHEIAGKSIKNHPGFWSQYTMHPSQMGYQAIADVMSAYIRKNYKLTTTEK